MEARDERVKIYFLVCRMHGSYCVHVYVVCMCVCVCVCVCVCMYVWYVHYVGVFTFSTKSQQSTGSSGQVIGDILPTHCAPLSSIAHLKTSTVLVHSISQP